MKKGWLVVNGFLKSAKFSEIYSFFQKSAQKMDVSVQIVASDSLAMQAPRFQLIEKPDFVLFWDKDVHLARQLEHSGFKLFNNAQAIETCDNKILTALKLLDVVPMPQTLFSPKTFPFVGYPNLDFVNIAVKKLGLPLVIKEAQGSFGEQVYLVHSRKEAEAKAASLAGKDFLFQHFVSESFGRDIRLNVVGGKVVNAVLRQGQEGDFRSNITLGGTMTPYRPTCEEVAIAEKAAKTIGLDFAGVDVLFGDNGPLLCEVNSNPHFKSTFQCTGVDLSEHILQHILSNC